MVLDSWLLTLYNSFCIWFKSKHLPAFEIKLTKIRNYKKMHPDYSASALFLENYRAVAPVVVNQGGTSSGKTFAIIQVLFCLACENEKLIITVVGQDIPNLKAGALRDSLKIYADSVQVAACVKSYNKSERIFEFHNDTDNGTTATHGSN